MSVDSTTHTSTEVLLAEIRKSEARIEAETKHHDTLVGQLEEARRKKPKITARDAVDYLAKEYALDNMKGERTYWAKINETAIDVVIRDHKAHVENICAVSPNGIPLLMCMESCRYLDEAAKIAKEMLGGAFNHNASYAILELCHRARKANLTHVSYAVKLLADRFIELKPEQRPAYLSDCGRIVITVGPVDEGAAKLLGIPTQSSDHSGDAADMMIPLERQAEIFNSAIDWVSQAFDCGKCGCKLEGDCPCVPKSRAFKELLALAFTDSDQSTDAPKAEVPL